MDPITAAIVAVLPALASDLVKSSVKDAYEALKAVIRRKWGEASAVAEAVDALEADPSSKQQAALADKVAATKAAEDPDVMKALAALVAELKEAKVGGNAVAAINVAISGGVFQGVVGAEKVSVGTMNFGTAPKDTKN